MLKFLRTVVLILVIVGGLAWWLGADRMFKQFRSRFKEGYSQQPDSTP